MNPEAKTLMVVWQPQGEQDGCHEKYDITDMYTANDVLVVHVKAKDEQSR